MADIEKLSKNIQVATAVGYPLNSEETEYLDAALREKAENDKLREAGRLVVLPDIKQYKTLYWLWGDEIMPVKYMGIRGGCVNKGKFHITCNMNTKRDRTFIHNGKSFTYKAGDHRMFYSDDIGKTVFPTREEAEKALEGLK